MNEAQYETERLQEKTDRTLTETARFLTLRLRGDQTKPDARLMIVYREAGMMFRRVFCEGLTGNDIHRMTTAADGLESCAKVFRQYEESHKAKGTPDGNRKAKANAEMAEACERALA